MYSLNVVYKQKTKKITLPKNINQQDLLALISESFRLKEKVIGLTNAKGNLVNIQQFLKKSEKQTLFLITAQDLNGDNMSFASDGGQNMRQNFLFQEEKQPGFIIESQVKIPQKGEGNYQGVIGDLQLFQSLFLQEGKMTIVLCFIKQKPRNFSFPYYLYHTAKNSVMIYTGKQRICEFFVESMNDIPKQVTKFIKSSLGEKVNVREHEQKQEEILRPFSKIKPKSKATQKRNVFPTKTNGHVNKKRQQQLQRDFFEHQYEQLQDYDDNKQAQQLLNQFGDQQPVQPQHEQQYQQQIYGQQLQQQQQDDQQQELPIFQSQHFKPKPQQQQQQKVANKNITNKPTKNKPNGIVESQEIQDQQYAFKQIDNQQEGMRASLLQNLFKLKQDEDITQLEFYKMKSQLLENLSDFMRKYQMGTRKGFRKHQKQQRQYRKNDRQLQEDQEREQVKREKKNNSQKAQQNAKLKSRQNKQRPMSPLSESSSEESQLIAPQRPQEKLRQRLKERQPTGEKKQRSKRQQQQRQNIELQKQNRLRQTKKSSQHEKQQQVSYRETNTRPTGQNINVRQSSPRQKNFPTPYSNERRRSKKYEIPIIVRKYNNVIEKISTSYPLSQQQQQAINLILQLQLKGLITEKQSGVYKSSILQQDKDIFPLFLDYFDHLIDQLQLVSRLKTIKRINSQKKQRSQHNMRLLIKYAKQSSYQLLRNLLLENNHLVLGALDKFRGDKNGENLTKRLEKIAKVYRQKSELETEVLE